MLFILFEFAIALIVLLVAGIWWWKTDGPVFEPVIATLIGFGVLIDVARRIQAAWRAPHQHKAEKQRNDDKIGAEKVPEVTESNEANLSSTVFFYRRFSDAFPGVRDSVECSQFLQSRAT